jgi:hypothetical protein
LNRSSSNMNRSGSSLNRGGSSLNNDGTSDFRLYPGLNRRGLECFRADIFRNRRETAGIDADASRIVTRLSRIVRVTFRAGVGQG